MNNSKLPIDKRSPYEFWDEQHKHLASNPLTWTIEADKLLRAFELIAAQVETESGNRSMIKYIPEVESAALMLAGFAIENMFKGLYVSRNPAFSNAGKLNIATHDLLNLANMIGFPLSQDEKILLERLEHFLRWAGRYPVPLNRDDMRPRTTPSGGFAPITYRWVGEHFMEIRVFSKKLRAMLPNILDGTNTEF